MPETNPRKRRPRRYPWLGETPPRFMDPIPEDRPRLSTLGRIYSEKKKALWSVARSSFNAYGEMYLEFRFGHSFGGHCNFQVLGNYSFLAGYHKGVWTRDYHPEYIVEIDNNAAFDSIKPELEELGVWNWKPQELGMTGFDGWGSSIQLGTGNGILKGAGWCGWPIDLRPDTYETFFKFSEIVGPAFGQPELPFALKEFNDQRVKEMEVARKYASENAD